ncbi:Hypothetical predicted protein [Pelobates cultripes]|uniref:Uncharacterized protein n=1 Tax=Pelobates cultripes TaxID=61616 RepID=A0AAD1W855_PELCU|nr:Hypothetical predicted protein [Pelobates cultripes]
MAAAELGTDTEFEVSAEEDTGIGLQMQLLSSQRSEERHRDHCDYLLDAIDEQLDQLQPRPTLKNSQKNADENSKSEVFNADTEQSHGQTLEIDSRNPKNEITDGLNEQKKECKKEEYKWRLTHLLGSEQTDLQEYHSDSNSAESVCTEDFVVQFNQRLVEPIVSNNSNEVDDLNGAQSNNEKSKFVENNLENAGLPEDNFSLNTARREDILQQFKEELEGDLKAAVSINDEVQCSGSTRSRRESVESLGGRISRLSQANILTPSSLSSFGKTSSVGSHFSSGAEDQQRSMGSQKDHQVDNKAVLYPLTSTIMEDFSRKIPLVIKPDLQDVSTSSLRVNPGLQGKTIDHKLDVCSSTDPSHFLDKTTPSFVVEGLTDYKTSGHYPDQKSQEEIRKSIHTAEIGFHAESWINLSKDTQKVCPKPPAENVEKSFQDASSQIQLHYGDNNALKSLCSDKDGMQRKGESFPPHTQSSLETSYTFGLRSKDHSEDLKTMDSSLKEEKAGVTQYKHIAGIPLKSFDTVTVDSDLDSVTTERVWDHIRKARGIKKGHADSGHSTRRLHWNHNERVRYTASSKMSKDDDDEEEFEIASTQWRSGSTKQWTSSPNKAQESITRAISSDFQDSPDQAQYRRAIEDLATEQVLLEESAAKLRRDAIVEEERLTKKKAQCREADLSLNDILLQKKEAYLELESLRDLLERTRNEAVRMETHVRETQMAEESLRSELVLLEYKHSDYLKELKELEMELDSIKQQCSSAHSSQISNLKYEISSLTNERDELKARLRHTEGSLTFMERQELERQLSNAKSELFSEQRTTRAKIVKLEENLEESQCKLEEKITECAEKQEKNKQLKSQLRELEKKYESQIQKQEEEASEQNEDFNQQVTELSSQVREQNTRIASLEKILSEKELDLLRLRDVISSLKAEKEAQVFAAEALKEEQNKRVLDLQQLHQQDKIMTDRQLAELKEQMHCQKQMEIQQFAENMEQVKIKALQDQAESLRKETDKALKTLEGKDKEIAKLKETLKSQKESMKKLAAELKQEAREMVHNTLLREQKKWEGEKKDALQIQRHTLEEQKLQDMADLREALENEHRMVMTLERKLADLQNEIQEHEIHKRSLLRENQEALDELRAVLKEEKQQELMKLQQELSQDRDRDLERLKIRLQQMEEEQHVLRAEKNEAVFREREALAHTERAERALAREITAECEHIMNTPGRPRTQSPSRSRSQSCLSTNQALQMLHGVNEENNQFIHELQQEVEAQKRTVIHVQREKERELQQLKEQLQMDKEKALSLLKERLIQEHIEEITNMQRDQLRGSNGPDGQSLRQQLREKDNELRAIQRNMAKWKEETATKLAQKFEEELNVELEKSLSRSKASESHRYTERVGSGVCRLSGINDRRENSHLRSASTPSLNGVSAQHDFGALKILRNLQGRVRELRADRRVYRGASMEDLSMLRSDLGNSLIEKRPLMPDRCMTPLQGRSIRK